MKFMVHMMILALLCIFLIKKHIMRQKGISETFYMTFNFSFSFNLFNSNDFHNKSCSKNNDSDMSFEKLWDFLENSEYLGRHEIWNTDLWMGQSYNVSEIRIIILYDYKLN